MIVYDEDFTALYFEYGDEEIVGGGDDYEEKKKESYS